ncbi:hypothetical protein HPB50_021966 [Hyalomma asiaticum]|uniref:Uncharacterized protein n=1 Tax=Hyalomma asiaticum TaxID=266040 RepID=A0ACB7TL38_HYAAI|nr:hypothetical protein HPB50_021966 [Hyalomma asiaticum]
MPVFAKWMSLVAPVRLLAPEGLAFSERPRPRRLEWIAHLFRARVAVPEWGRQVAAIDIGWGERAMPLRTGAAPGAIALFRRLCRWAFLAPRPCGAMSFALFLSSEPYEEATAQRPPCSAELIAWFRRVLAASRLTTERGIARGWRAGEASAPTLGGDTSSSRDSLKNGVCNWPPQTRREEGGVVCRVLLPN